jgi:hypothetical protein
MAAKKTVKRVVVATVAAVAVAGSVVLGPVRLLTPPPAPLAPTVVVSLPTQSLSVGIQVNP